MKFAHEPYHSKMVILIMQKILVLSGIILILIGILTPWLRRSGLGHLPGDIIIKRGSFGFYFPLTTCLIASIALTLIFYLWNRSQ